MLGKGIKFCYIAIPPAPDLLLDSASLSREVTKSQPKADDHIEFSVD